jgi:hypothetical protein
VNYVGGGGSCIVVLNCKFFDTKNAMGMILTCHELFVRKVNGTALICLRCAEREEMKHRIRIIWCARM